MRTSKTYNVSVILSVLLMLLVSNVYSKQIVLQKPYVEKNEKIRMEILKRNKTVYDEHGNSKIYYYEPDKRIYYAPNVSLLKGDKLRIEISDIYSYYKDYREMNIVHKSKDESGIITYLGTERECYLDTELVGCKGGHISVVLKDYRKAKGLDQRDYNVTMDIYKDCYLGDSCVFNGSQELISTFVAYPYLDEYIGLHDMKKVENDGNNSWLRDVKVKWEGSLLVVEGYRSLDERYIQEELTIEVKRRELDGSTRYYASNVYQNRNDRMSVVVEDNRLKKFNGGTGSKDIPIFYIQISEEIKSCNHEWDGMHDGCFIHTSNTKLVRF